MGRAALVGLLALAACTDEGADALSRAGDDPVPGGPLLEHPTPILRPTLPPGAPHATPGFGYSGRALLEPRVGTFFGANLNFDRDTIEGFDRRLGHDAATYVQFVDFPMDAEDERVMGSFLEEVAAHRGIAVATFEPQIPLADVTPEMAEDLADFLAAYNVVWELGILVRFAHEMNGSWYAWSQQPTEYRRVYRMVAEAVHRAAPRTGMLWAPSYAGGYPFGGGPYEAEPGDPDFERLDTDGDGELTMEDDAYGPYWPGDRFVDWVGLSLYHWGDDHPWGDNELPEPGKFVAQITGKYSGYAGDERGLDDFYATFAEGHDKPMAIVETAALYNPGRPGDELELKRSWWRQVFDPGVFERFPRLRMINWFEWDKDESEIGGERIDWTVTVDPVIRDAFLADFPVDRLVLGPLPVYQPE